MSQDRYDRNKFVASVYGSIYNEHDATWGVEPSFTWFFNRYIGVSAGLEFTGQVLVNSYFTQIDGYEAICEEDELQVMRFNVKPAVVFRSPYLWRSKIDGFYRLWVQGEAGLGITGSSNSVTFDLIGYNGNMGRVVGFKTFHNQGKSEWLYWHSRASVNFALEHFVIGTGFGVSTLDYYSGRRNITLQNGKKLPVPSRKRWSQNLFLSLSYCF